MAGFKISRRLKSVEREGSRRTTEKIENVSKYLSRKNRKWARL